MKLVLQTQDLNPRIRRGEIPPYKGASSASIALLSPSTYPDLIVLLLEYCPCGEHCAFLLMADCTAVAVTEEHEQVPKVLAFLRAAEVTVHIAVRDTILVWPHL